MVAVLAIAAAAGCAASSPPASPPLPLPDRLAAHVSIDAMMAHLQTLQEIADANDGNRADGTSGFEAGADYVANTLRDNGFEVSTPEFERLDQISAGKPTMTVGGRGYPVDQASLLLQTPPGGVTGPVLRPSAAAGCGAGDYRSGGPRGGIAVVDDTDCSVVQKQQTAATAGAAALVVISAGGRNGSPAGLFVPGYYEQLSIPVAVAGAEAGAALRRASTPVRLVLDGRTVKVRSRNVLAQTRSGSTENVVVVGAHLDSVGVGAGINDNGSGVAAVLETALRLGAVPDAPNAVRFAFWGGSKDQLAGSLRYVSGLSRDELNDIALYLNFDEIASPNAGFFTLDGDQSGPAGPDIGPDDVPIGSAGVERTLAGYLNLSGKRPADMALGVGTDDSAFLHAGIPVGGITTGGPQVKTAAQARLWGGRAGAQFDPNYRTARDTVTAVNRDALAVTGSGVAFAVGTYADSVDGVNGVPSRAQRHRTPTGP